MGFVNDFFLAGIPAFLPPGTGVLSAGDPPRGAGADDAADLAAARTLAAAQGQAAVVQFLVDAVANLPPDSVDDSATWMATSNDGNDQAVPALSQDVDVPARHEDDVVVLTIGCGDCSCGQ